MKIAVTSEEKSIQAMVPESYEKSPVLLIVESDTMRIVDMADKQECYFKTIMKYDCEVVVCGPHIEKEAFEPIAEAGITRCNGSGFTVEEAVRYAVINRLPYIRDYEGGDGCHH